MQPRIRGVAVAIALVAGAATAISLSACGSSSSGSASTLLKQTFSGSHRIDSGNLAFSLTVTPSGSKTLTGPLTLSFGGPFQSLGTGKLPASNFTISLSGLGKTGSLSLLSTGQTGFVTLQGTSYQMPAATYTKIESSFAGLTSTAGSSSGSSALSRLGIDPLRWLVKPTIAGEQSIGGADTTHVKAGVNIAALLGDLDTFLQKASSVGVANASKIPTSISATTKAKIAGEVQNPHFDVWTGKSDKTPRKLAIELTLPVAGQVATLLGGLNSADVALSVEYDNLNQRQTITAPTKLRPFSEFTAKLRTFEQALQGALGGTLGSGLGATGSGTTGTATPGTTSTATPGTTSTSTPGSATGGTSPAVTSYSKCIQAAGSDVTKMQQCVSLLSGSGAG